MTVRKGSVREDPMTALDQAQDETRYRESLKIIRVRALQLCQSITAIGPHNKRMEQALVAIKTGVKLSIDEIEDDRRRAQGALDK